MFEKIINSVLKRVKGLASFLLGHFDKLFSELWAAKDGVQFRFFVLDILSVIFSTGFFGLLNLLAFMIFIVLPQGKDILMIVVEEVGSQNRYGNLIWLLFGTFLWSIVSEFGARYAIYVTDRSGRNLTAQRVLLRKVIQRIIAEIYLLLPYVIVLLGLGSNYFQAGDMQASAKNLGFGIPFILIYFLLNFVAHFYFDEAKRETWRKGNNKFLNFFLLPQKESEWCNKLYGIYNDYIFTLRKPQNFTGDFKTYLEKFEADMKFPSGGEKYFPQSAEGMASESRVPQEFVLKDFNEESFDNGMFRWVYNIPKEFFKTLHNQLKTIVALCSIVFLVTALLPVGWYKYPGAPALVVIAFACYGGMYLFLLYLDFAVFKKGKIPLRLVLVALLIFCSFVNDDHPVRVPDNGKAFCSSDNRPSITDHFEKWISNYSKDSTNAYLKTNDTAKAYPVVFVCAEGGALRTGAFTALSLSLIHDSVYNNFDHTDFSRSIYAYSGVSGGALGTSFYNAVTSKSNPDELIDHSTDSLAREFFNEDFLSPVIGKMFYGELINLFSPWHIERFDRAIALEKAWENAFDDLLKTQNGNNVFSSTWEDNYNTGKVAPALFINTSEVETGTQCWISNVTTNNFALNKHLRLERDMFRKHLTQHINYSTAINFSTRFPLFSPAACIKENDVRKRHYVDGGYIENTGAGTMLEIMQTLTPQFEKHNIKPYVLMLRYNEDNGKISSINLANEISEIINGIYNTRGGRSKMAVAQLEHFVKDSLNGQVIELAIGKSGKDVPMNWVFSERSLNNLKNDIKYKWERRQTNSLDNLIYFDTGYVRFDKRKKF